MRRRHQLAALWLTMALAGPQAVLAQSGGAVDAPLAGGVASAPMIVDAPAPRGEGVLPVITLDQEELYARSKWGQRVHDELEKSGQEIADENDRLANQFSAEEQALTSLRQTLPADEFRKRAEEFDKRVVEVRRQREAAADALKARAVSEQQAFFHAVLPQLDALMRERGAVVVLDQRAIFVAAQSIDVTEALIERIDREIGAGPLQAGPDQFEEGQPAETQPEESQPTESTPAEPQLQAPAD
jgi:Skp family chaperone for outer membrane proteins